MRVLIQRVNTASVEIDRKIMGYIKQGLLIFVGIDELDTIADIEYLVNKIVNLRIFADSDGVMNLSVQQIGGEILVVSQFTLHASTKKGNRPSYIKAAKPEIAVSLYKNFISILTTVFGNTIETGEFGADMKIALVNDGPVTIWMDSKVKG